MAVQTMGDTAAFNSAKEDAFNKEYGVLMINGVQRQLTPEMRQELAQNPSAYQIAKPGQDGEYVELNPEDIQGLVNFDTNFENEYYGTTDAEGNVTEGTIANIPPTAQDNFAGIHGDTTGSRDDQISLFTDTLDGMAGTNETTDPSLWTQNYSPTTVGAVNNAFQGVLGRDPGDSGAEYWAQMAVDNGWDQTQLEDAITQSVMNTGSGADYDYLTTGEVSGDTTFLAEGGDVGVSRAHVQDMFTKQTGRHPTEEEWAGIDEYMAGGATNNEMLQYVANFGSGDPSVYNTGVGDASGGGGLDASALTGLQGGGTPTVSSADLLSQLSMPDFSSMFTPAYSLEDVGNTFQGIIGSGQDAMNQAAQQNMSGLMGNMQMPQGNAGFDFGQTQSTSPMGQPQNIPAATSGMAPQQAMVGGQNGRQPMDNFDSAMGKLQSNSAPAPSLFSGASGMKSSSGTGGQFVNMNNAAGTQAGIAPNMSASTIPAGGKSLFDMFGNNQSTTAMPMSIFGGYA